MLSLYLARVCVHAITARNNTYSTHSEKQLELAGHMSLRRLRRGGHDRGYGSLLIRRAPDCRFCRFCRFWCCRLGKNTAATVNTSGAETMDIADGVAHHASSRTVREAKLLKCWAYFDSETSSPRTKRKWKRASSHDEDGCETNEKGRNVQNQAKGMKRRGSFCPSSLSFHDELDTQPMGSPSLSASVDGGDGDIFEEPLGIFGIEIDAIAGRDPEFVTRPISPGEYVSDVVHLDQLNQGSERRINLTEVLRSRFIEAVMG